jgi:hypothetical protein
LHCQAATVGNGEGFLEACHAREKMILPCAYGLFGGVWAMDIWGSVLDASVFCGNKRFDVLW